MRRKRTIGRRRRRLNIKGILMLLLSIAVLAGLAYGVYYIIDSNRLTIVLNGKSVVEVDFDTLYVDAGAYVTKKGELTDHEIVVDSSKVDRTKLGTYDVTYTIKGKKRHKKVRQVKVMDKEMPNIMLAGYDVSIPVNGSFSETGYTAFDNIDGDITDKVVVSNNIDTSKQGIYKVTYSVNDKAGNEYVTERRVYVGLRLPTEEEMEYVYSENLELKDQVRKMNWTKSGFDLVGHLQGNFTNVAILDSKNNKEYLFAINKSLVGYSVSIDLSEVENGVYDLVAYELDKQALINELDATTRLIRAKVGDKLVSFDYTNNTMRVTVEDLEYEYDIVIEAGHGGKDPGSVNSTVTERDLNLIVSLYEKERYEAHGLRVKLDRTVNENYGEQMGSSSWGMLKRNVYAMGTYGTVSKFAYGNHHNSFANSSASGWEMIVNATATSDDLAIEHKIAAQWDRLFPNSQPRRRFYTRGYDDELFYDKRQGQVYNFKEYYGMQRLNRHIFGLDYTTYEHSYLSNPGEFQWYYTEENWKKVAEAKIKYYVEACGKEYIAP